MSHRNYSAQEKLRALDQLEINGGNLLLTSQQTGISDRTLLRWRQKYAPTTTTATTTPPREVVTPPIAADDVQAIRILKHQMMEKAKLLNDSIDDAIAEAPLPQRISALTQLVDRIIVLGRQLPAEPERYEYELEDSEGEEPRYDEVEIETSEGPSQSEENSGG